MKCLLCGRRKGKRHCPAKNGLICGQCCGEKRVVEVDCPKGCGYLQEGLSYEWERIYLDQLHSFENREALLRYQRTNERFPNLLFTLEEEVVKYSVEVSALTDRDVLQALELYKRNLETESKGIIFTHQSPNPLAESLCRELRQGLERLEEDEALPSLRNADLLDCLDCLLLNARHLMERTDIANPYLRHLRRQRPDLSSKRERSRIITP